MAGTQSARRPAAAAEWSSGRLQLKKTRRFSNDEIWVIKQLLCFKFPRFTLKASKG